MQETPVPAAKVGDNLLELTINGSMAETEQHITAYLEQENEEGETEAVTVGQLNIASYQPQPMKVVLVPVNEATINANLVSNYLNETYKQAVTSWQVIDGNDYQVNQEVLNAFDEGESGLLASFPRNMRQFIRDYKRNIENYDKDAYYVFIIEDAPANRAGFMPFKRQFGFVFSDNTPNLERTIAHELGHVEPCEIPSSGALGERRFGRAFRLRHTFSSKDFIANQGDTDNLMDYSQGNHLHKQQWDYIHDPQAMIGWFEDDEEFAYTNEDIITFGVLKIDLTKYGFMTPSGVGFLLPPTVQKVRCHKRSGALYEFDYNEQTYAYVEVGGKGFSGYLSKEKIKDLGLTKGTIASEELQVRITDFLLHYIPESDDIISYYHKNTVEKFMFLKYDEKVD